MAGEREKNGSGPEKPRKLVVHGIRDGYEQPPAEARVSSSVASRVDGVLNGLSARRNFACLPYKEVKRPTDVYVVPDIHGDVMGLFRSLCELGVINSSGEWIAGDSVCVFLGDYLDRRIGGLMVIDVIRNLRDSAAQNGGRVETLLGNHEAAWVGMLLGSYKWLLNSMIAGAESTLEGTALYTRPDSERCCIDNANEYVRRNLFSMLRALSFVSRHYLDFLVSLPPFVQVDDILFVHGGLSVGWASRLAMHGVDTLNRKYFESLNAIRALRRNVLHSDVSAEILGTFFDDDHFADRFDVFNEFAYVGSSRDLEDGNACMEPGGPLWYGFDEYKDTHPQDIKRISDSLKGMGINAMFVGHSAVSRPYLSPAFLQNDFKAAVLDVGLARRKTDNSYSGARVFQDGGIIAYGRDFPIPFRLWDGGR